MCRPHHHGGRRVESRLEPCGRPATLLLTLACAPSRSEDRQCRPHRENLHLAGDVCSQALTYDQEQLAQWAPKQESAKFHVGFYRRQQGTILQDAPRKQHAAAQEPRGAAIRQMRADRVSDATSFAYNGFDVITGADFDPTKDRGRHHEARAMARACTAACMQPAHTLSYVAVAHFLLSTNHVQVRSTHYLLKRRGTSLSLSLSLSPISRPSRVYSLPTKGAARGAR